MNIGRLRGGRVRGRIECGIERNREDEDGVLLRDEFHLIGLGDHPERVFAFIQDNAR